MKKSHPLLRTLRSLVNTYFPRFCCVCGKRLYCGEEHTCSNCLLDLPRTRLYGKKNNIIERLLWDDVIYTQRANSFMYYYQKSPYCNIFFHFKYYNHPHIAVAYGRIMAAELLNTGFFDGIDCMVPIPLSRQRFRKRGYNQSERLAEGIRQITGIPIDTHSVVRCTNNVSQTQLSDIERWDNVEEIFQLTDADTLQNKHILIVDDMITTGSTIRSCAHAILGAPGVKLSVISLGTSHHNRQKVFADEMIRKEMEEA